MYFISQLGEQDCAFACLKMMLANYHHDRNYLYLPCDKEHSYSFKELCDIAEEHNLKLLGVKVDEPEELMNCKKFPLVVTLEKKKGVRHSVLVLKANHKHVHIYDPASGKRKMDTELFFEEWSGKALIVNEVVPTKIKEEIPDFVSKQDKIILPIIQILSGVSLLAGTYFISGTYPYYFPVIFFGLFFIFEIIFRKEMVSALRRVDENIFSHRFKKDDKGYLEIYKTIEKYHYLALSSTTSFLYAILVSIFIAVILVINDVYNAIYVILPFGIALLERLLYKPYFQEKELEIMDMEKDIAEVDDDSKFKLLCDETHNLAYTLGLNKTFFNYLVIALLLLAIILTMVLTKTMNITYVVFYLCITLFLKQNYLKLIECCFHDSEYDYVKAKLVNYAN